MNKLFLICCLSYCSLFAYGQVASGVNFDWSYLPVTSEHFQMYKGDGESLYNDVDWRKGLRTSQLYSISKGNVEKTTLLYYTIEEKFGKPVVSSDAYRGLEVTYNQAGKILKKSNTSIEQKIIPGGYGGNFEFGSNGISGITYSFYDDKIIYEYNKDGYVETATYHSRYGYVDDKTLIFKYAYIPNTNRISSVTAYNGETAREEGKVNYSYDDQGRLVRLYGTHLTKGKNEKQIKYDAYGNISFLSFAEYGLGGNYKKQTYIYNNHYNEKGLLYRVEYQYIYDSQVQNYSSQSSSANYVSSYKYDALGNWVEVSTIDEKGVGECTKRTITYRVRW